MLHFSPPSKLTEYRLSLLGSPCMFLDYALQCHALPDVYPED